MAMDSDDTVSLGGSIQLTGFRELDRSSSIILKKIVGNYARRFSEICQQFESLQLTMKPVHEREKSEKYEIHALLKDKGQNYAADVTDRNLFFAIDSALKKVESEISK
ncbi:hypothetical protein JXB11_02580 [Candidatus Woesearchaeota archaeon]|nr:hypothetical protein [Candidatus Woesearchaeota archaeon]